MAFRIEKRHYGRSSSSLQTNTGQHKPNVLATTSKLVRQHLCRTRIIEAFGYLKKPLLSQTVI